MKAQGQLITLQDHFGAKAVIAPDLGAWLLRYTRHLPQLGYVEGLYFAQEVVDRYPNQMYTGNPLLFPQVSFSHLPGQEHHYEWEGKTYALPQHGFARRSKWKVAGVTETRLTMELADTPQTRGAYPFSFCSTVVYELREGRLHFRQTVENRGAKPMPFSAGIHPYLPVSILTCGLVLRLQGHSTREGSMATGGLLGIMAEDFLQTGASIFSTSHYGLLTERCQLPYYQPAGFMRTRIMQ